MIVKYSKAKEFICPIMDMGRKNCISLKCMLWKWELNQNLYYKKYPNYAANSPLIEKDFTISFEKGASGKRVNIGEAMGKCGLIK